MTLTTETTTHAWHALLSITQSCTKHIAGPVKLSLLQITQTHIVLYSDQISVSYDFKSRFILEMLETRRFRLHSRSSINLGKRRRAPLRITRSSLWTIGIFSSPWTIGLFSHPLYTSYNTLNTRKWSELRGFSGCDSHTIRCLCSHLLSSDFIHWVESLFPNCCLLTWSHYGLCPHGRSIGFAGDRWRSA